jgi:hypothetical protein
LKVDGNVIFIPLEYREVNLVKTSLKRLHNVDMEEYSNKVGHIGLNPDLEAWRRMGRDTLEVSLLKTDVWDAAMNEAESLFASGGVRYHGR